MTTESDDLWVFGYGSLMWRPGFDYVERLAVRLNGYHRDFCVWSHRYRGTPERPGLVLGLDRGGSCRGIAYRIAPENREAVLAYLHEREMITGVYDPRYLPIIDPLSGRRAVAQSYVVDRTHPQYAAGLTVEHSQAGLYLWASADEPCRETVDRLAGLGILVAPGEFYGPAGARHVRVGLTAPDERIDAAVERLGAA